HRGIHSSSLGSAPLSIRTEQASRRAAHAFARSSPTRVHVDARGPGRSCGAVFFHRDLESPPRLGVLGRRVRSRGGAESASGVGRKNDGLLFCAASASKRGLFVSIQRNEQQLEKCREEASGSR